MRLFKFRTWLLAIPLLFAAAPALAMPGPVEVIRNTTDQLYQAVQEYRDNPQSGPSDLEAAVRRLLLPVLDMDYSGRLVLGRYARKLSSEQIQAFSEALANMLIERYAAQLAQFKDRAQVEVLPLDQDQINKDVTRVRTRIHLKTGKTIPVDYVMHKTDEGWKVFDVVVQGISYVVTFRSQFSQELSRYTFEEVLDRIRSGQVDVVQDDGAQ